MKILRLTLKRAPFEVMVTGEKTYEFRTPGKWIESRLFDPADGERPAVARTYDLVEFTNGYGRHRPRFTAKYLGFGYIPCGVDIRYSNGLHVYLHPRSALYIEIGEIVSVENYSIR